jgi:hypothetical protein
VGGGGGAYALDIAAVAGVIWTEEKIAELRRLRLTMSEKQIGDLWGCGKNAIAGKCWRLGLAAPDLKKNGKPREPQERIIHAIPEKLKLPPMRPRAAAMRSMPELATMPEEPLAPEGQTLPPVSKPWPLIVALARHDGYQVRSYDDLPPYNRARIAARRAPLAVASTWQPRRSRLAL